MMWFNIIHMHFNVYFAEENKYGLYFCTKIFLLCEVIWSQWLHYLLTIKSYVTLTVFDFEYIDTGIQSHWLIICVMILFHPDFLARVARNIHTLYPPLFLLFEMWNSMPLPVGYLQYAIYSGSSLSGHSQQRPFSKATNIFRYYYQCIYFSLSPKATTLMWPHFLGK